MDHKQIQTVTNRLAKAMTAKGLREPSAEVQIESHAEMTIVMRWKDARVETYISDSKYKFIRGGDLKEMIAEADAYIAELPSAEETRMNEFMGALGKVIDLGRKNGVEADYLNPLVASMKKLSENIITHDRAA